MDMIFLTNVYRDIVNDFAKEQYKNSNILSRRFILKNNIVVLISVYKKIQLCEVSVSLKNDVTSDSLNAIPKWKGMEERLSEIYDDGEKRKFLSFKQIEDYERKIFFIIMQDIIEALYESSRSETLNLIKEVLVKWNVFFQFDKDFVLSDNVQQGLYGELYLLEKLIALKGEKALECWTGCNAETHDFYCGIDAIEVKSSSAKDSNRVNISNEYQLDDTGILGRLYLFCLKFKKSEIDGECLSEIVKRISTMLSPRYRFIFYNKLLKIGYIHQMPELYKIHFKIREENCYDVAEGFPRITTKIISKGITSVDYTISLDACNAFQITIESFYKGVDL
jgi:hypothetical protein